MNKKEFLELLDKYLAGEALPEEEELLFKVYESFQDKHELDEKELEAINLFENKLFEKLKNNINQSEENPPPQVRYIFIRKFLVAASVTTLLALGFQYIFKPRLNITALTNIKKSAPAHDFKPGGNNAYLILANGKKVYLNKAKTGLLARQGGNSVIKQNDGQIQYTRNGSVSKDSILLNKIVVPAGGQYKVTLPDGTQAWLNSSSSLEYPVQFAGRERLIKLSGEAYFEVVKNKNMPFIVNVNSKMNVKVLGTHFNIMGYGDENKIITTLLEGSVKIEDSLNPSGSTYLVPGQQAERLNSNGKIKVAPAGMDEAIAWKEGQFLFNNENIHSIMRKLSRWYDVEVVFSTEMKDKSFDGAISKYKNISSVLKLMELTKSVHFKLEGRRIIVMP